jgi:signal transduction histidine kinase/ligand-binding sensor domain-containing protein/DNA-binding response OmpR family regulator
MYKHYDVTTGLSNNKINAIYKDSKGFIWIGTASGLNRFDGGVFKVYRSIKDDDKTLTDNYIASIQEFDNGDLLIESGLGFVRYDRKHDRFIRHIDYIDSLQQPTHAYIDNGKNEWYYDRNRGVTVRKKGAQEFRVVSDKSHLLTAHDVTDIRQVGSNIVCINDCGDLIFIDIAKAAVVHNVVTSSKSGGGKVNTAFCDNSNRLWIYDLDGLRVYNTSTHQIDANFSGKFDNTQTIRAVTQDASGKIWLGYDHKGLAIIDPNTASQLALTDDESFKNFTISALYTDDDGSVWIGTYKKGLYQYNEHSFKFKLREIADVNCEAGLSDEAVWVGTDSGLLIKWNRITNTVETYYDADSQSRDKAIVCLCTTDNAGVWMGTYRDGLKYFVNGKFVHIGTADGLAHENVWSIVDAGDGKLWLGTLGGGLQLFDTYTRKFETFDTRNTLLLNDYINSLCKTSDGKLYIGTSYGISVMDLSTHRISTKFGSHDGVKSFPNPNIMQIYEDSRHLLWIATSEGIYLYNKSNDKLIQVGDKTEFILGFVEDKQGCIWVSVGASLYKLTVTTDKSGEYQFTYNRYSQSDGLQNSDFNQRSFYRLPSGVILVGGLYGVNSFMPQTIQKSVKHPRVLFSGFSIQNKLIEVGNEYDGNVVLSSELNCGEAVNLSYKQNEFTVYFSSDNFIDSEETQYYYRLVGFNNEWVKCAPNMHQATYTNLPYGEYTLEVKAVNNDGTESETVSSLTIVVHPPFWLSVWAKILYVILFVAAISYVVIMVKRREQRKYQEQQREETIKHHEEITQMKFRFFTNISHELRTPLTLIISPIEAILKEITDEKQRHRLEIVRGNANRLLYLVNQLLDFRKNEMTGLKFLPEEGDVVPYIKNLCDSFGGFSEGKNVKLTFFSSADSLKMSYDVDKMGKIILNLLSNAFKYTPDGGRVDVALTQVNDNLVIKVADTGSGIDDKDKALIFERFYQTDSSKSGGSGIGLSLVNEYVKLHDGTAEVVDNIGGGSVFIITIPIRHIMPAPEKKVEPVEEKSENKVEEVKHDGRPIVLLVDDNTDLLAFLDEEMSDQFKVVTAKDGQEALNIIERTKPDVVVTDLMMPIMDGIELCRQLKSNKKYSSIPIIVLSAKHDNRAMVEGLTIGADDYITKPFNFDVLKLRVKKLLDLRHKGVQRSLIEPEPTPIKVTSLDEKLIESAVKYVEENMDRADLSVEELSRHLGMSRVHLYKRMRQITGKTPIEFIRVLRLKRAAQLLRESQQNVSEIAYQVGFNNPKYFSSYFKEEFGVLPSVYQEQEGK